MVFSMRIDSDKMRSTTPQVSVPRFLERLMSRNLIAVTGVTVLLGLTLACTKSSTPLSPTTPGTPSTLGPTDESTLKVSPPAVQAPANETKPTTATLVVGTATPLFGGPTPTQYRFQVFNSANALVDERVVNGTSYSVTAELTENQRYTWRARGEWQGEVGPWSTSSAFIAPQTAFLGREIVDPLTNGKTVGIQKGGVFLPGQGWQSLSNSDGIDYDLTEPCVDNCTLTFDVTNFGPREGLSVEKDLKWITMGRPEDYANFFAFRNSPWKMQLIQRADHNTGMEIIWRNGDSGDGVDPGDHRIKLNQTPITFRSSDVYHFIVEWATTGFRITVNGTEVMREGWNRPYTPGRHRISLGCHPRGESFVGAIYRNIRLIRG
jgi:hypothetical protein